jgi:hypothetical protein
LDITAQADVYIMPVVNINIDHIGGPKIGFKGFVEPVIEFQSESPCSTSKPWGPAAKYTFNWGLQLTIGAFLNITVGDTSILPPKTWGPTQIFNLKWPLTSGCIHPPVRNILPLRNKRSDPMIVPHYLGDKLILFDGVAYSGQVLINDLPGCDQFLSIPVHFQLMNTSGADTHGFPVWTSNEPHNWNRTSIVPDTGINVGCVAQATYVADYGVFEVFYTPPGEPSIDYKNCTLDAIRQKYTIMSLSGAYSISLDESTLTITTGEQCIGTVVLSRQLPPRDRKRRLSVEAPDYTWGRPASKKVH